MRENRNTVFEEAYKQVLSEATNNLDKEINALMKQLRTMDDRDSKRLEFLQKLQILTKKRLANSGIVLK